MNETWKKRARLALRGFEILLAVTLLAVLLELLLVMVTAPGPVPEIRFIRTATPPPEENPTAGLIPANLPPVPERVLAEKPAVKAEAPAPRRPAAPVLLDFENLRRLLGGAKAPSGNNNSSGGGNAAGGGSPAAGPILQLVAINPRVAPATNGVPASPTPPPGTNNVPEPERPPETNRTDAAANASGNTNNVNTNLDSQVFRLSVP